MRQNHSQAESKQKHKKVEIRPAFISKVEKKNPCSANLNTFGEEWFERHLPVWLQKMP